MDKVQKYNSFRKFKLTFDNVCDWKGWHMATYRSTVNAVMVSTVALADVSAANP
jgi:hypothetical protein